MCTIDIILLVMFLPAIIEGLSKGLIKQVVDIAILVIGAWLSFRFSETLSVWIAQYITGVSETILMIISFILIFLLVMLLLSMLGRLLRKIIKVVMLGWVDRLLGLVFALLKSALVIGLLIILFESLNTLTGWVSQDDIQASRLYGPIKDFTCKIFPYFKSLIQEAAANV